MKIICEWNGNINKVQKEAERNSGDEKYNVYNEKFTRSIQRHIWTAEERISAHEYRTMEIIETEELEEERLRKEDRI